MSLNDRLEPLRRKLDPLIQLLFPDWQALKEPTPGLRPLPKNRMPTSRQLTGRSGGKWQNGMFDCDGRYLLWRTETPQFWTNKPSLIDMALMLSMSAFFISGVILLVGDWVS
ncbi:hypothetical protein CAI21_22505, partial [Alkalilimnicola ehrlichii]